MNTFATTTAALIVAFSACTRAQDALPGAASMSMDELFFHAQRHGTTRDKKLRRRDAKDELFKRGSQSLAYFISHAGVDNPWYIIYADQIRRQIDGADAVPVLLPLVDSDEERVRKTAVFFLGFYDAPDQAGLILPLLSDDALAGAATRTLGKWKVREAVPAIVNDLGHEKERRRILAANALRDIGDPSVAEALIACLDDESFTVRKVVSRALASLGAEVEARVLCAIPSAEPRALRELIWILGQLNTDNGRLALKRLCESDNEAVRRDAVRALTAENTAHGE